MSNVFYRIIAKADPPAVVNAVSSEEAMDKFIYEHAWNLSTYFRAIPATEEEVRSAGFDSHENNGEITMDAAVGAIRDYLVFETETSESYPFSKKADEVSLNELYDIAVICNGSTETENIHTACLQVLGCAEAQPSTSKDVKDISIREMIRDELEYRGFDPDIADKCVEFVINSDKQMTLLDCFVGNAIAAFNKNQESDTNSSIVDATFVSIWDGSCRIETRCKVNLETREVFDIEAEDDVEDLDILEEEFIEIDGTKYPVTRSDENPEEGSFWYD